MTKKTRNPAAAPKKVKANSKATVPFRNPAGATGQLELLLVDSTQDITVLRQKHESVNRWVEAMELILNRLKRKVEVFRVDAAMQSTCDANQLAQFLRMIANDLTELFMQIDVESLISEDLIHARSMFPPDVSGFAWRTIEIPRGNGSQIDKGLVATLLQHADAIIAVINTGLAPARRYRDEIEQVLQRKQVDSSPRTKVRRPGGQVDDTLPARDQRIRELDASHKRASHAELVEIANQDPQIQEMGLKKKITYDIVQAVREKRSRKSGIK